MSKDMMINILVNDGCTKRAAEEHIKLGTAIYTVEDSEEIKAVFNLTIEEIDAGNGGDVVATVYNGIKYYIAYAN